MAVAERAFGGWWIPLGEFKKNGINPFNDFKNVSFGITQDRVVFAVRDGKVDAGSVRTDMLERMAANGEIDLKAFRVLNQKHIKNFPFLLSTDVYPEWPFAKSSHTSSELSRLVSIALFNMPDYSNAAIAGKNAGWTVPLDYSSVHELMKDLRVGPYEHFGKATIGDFLRQYFYWLAAVIVIVLALAVITIYIGNLNGKIKQELLRRKKMEEQIKA